MKGVIVAFASAALAGCVSSSIVPIDQNTIMITTSGAPVCGASGTQGVAVHMAAVETIRRGYDRFIVLDAESANNVRVVGTTPIYANTYGSFGYGGSYRSMTTFGGGQPIVAGTYDQGLVIRMFRDNDPAGRNAVSARATLGPEWQTAVAEDKSSCF